jgi:hypothetical protein
MQNDDKEIIKPVLRLSSEKIPKRFTEYASLINAEIDNYLLKYQNGSFMPIMHDRPMSVKMKTVNIRFLMRKSEFFPKPFGAK